jgi:putative FmdB family regulatory protein
MPIYEYRCAACGNQFELTRPISQSGDPAPCTNCGKPSQKLISQFASKVDYAIKGPTKEPFRGNTATAATTSAATSATGTKAKAPAKAKGKTK